MKRSGENITSKSRADCIVPENQALDSNGIRLLKVDHWLGKKLLVNNNNRK
jgi:hypothetical protein